uniref:Uncharacterized protein n=1 Tax=viral metagenome TaxID=1070528 RepID=A0A6C0J7S8_9ZZZZ
MSFYKRYTSEKVTKTDFTLDKNNISFYREQCNDMDNVMRWTKSYLEIKSKLDNIDEQDYLFTPEYLKRRMDKLNKQHDLDDNILAYIDIKKQLDTVNLEIQCIFPTVMDKELGKNPKVHEEMSELNDKRKALEDNMIEVYTLRYPDLRKNLRDIFFMILDGVDMETVNKCFDNMISVLGNKMTTDEAANDLMDHSQTKYNLPETLYDPLRAKHGKAKRKKK